MSNFLKGGLAAAICASALAATPVMAGAQSEVVVASVRYSDLDLSTKQGQDRLHARLRGAARDVCGMDIRNPGTTLPSGDARACYVETMQSFEREVAAVIDQERRG